MKSFFHRRVPFGIRWTNAVYLTFLVVLVFEGLSGALIALCYSPGRDSSYASLEYFVEETVLGRFVRGLHAHGASLLVGLLLIHGLQVFVGRLYRGPRRFCWVLGVGVLVVLVGFTITGYLLPWDQNAYWGTQVRVSIMGRAPGVGPLLHKILVGGRELGNLTLTRFYALHVSILPILLLFLLALLGKWLRHCETEDLQENETGQTVRFWPDQVHLAVLTALAVVGGLFLFAATVSVDLGPKADPTVTYPARPEWFFRWLFQLLKYVSGSLEVLAAVAIVPVVLGILVSPVLLDGRQNPTQSRGRHLAVSILLALGFGWLGLTSYSYYEDYRAGYYEEIRLWDVKPDPEFNVDTFYKENCKNCHGRKGTGYLDATPNFSKAAYWQGVRNEVRLLKAILNGVPNPELPPDEVMPSFKERLTPEQAKAILDFKLKKFLKPPQ